MELFRLLRAIDPDLDPRQTKLHLATKSEEDPYHVFLDDGFDEWQTWQTKRNFGRPFVVSLIALPEPDRWLFAGAYESKGCEVANGKTKFRYDLTRRPAFDELSGRLIVSLKRPWRQAYPNGEVLETMLVVAEVRPLPIRVREFPGYARACVSKPELDRIVREGAESWRTALRSVGGIYLIADQHTGRLYVGSASGEDGLWGRWSQYAQSGHGGNAELREVLESNGPGYARHFQFAILEITDSKTSEAEVLERESYWKETLLSRQFGYNRN